MIVPRSRTWHCSFFPGEWSGATSPAAPRQAPGLEPVETAGSPKGGRGDDRQPGLREGTGLHGAISAGAFRRAGKCVGQSGECVCISGIGETPGEGMHLRMKKGPFPPEWGLLLFGEGISLSGNGVSIPWAVV